MIDERCLGSHRPPTAESVENDDAVTGECAVCGQRVTLGYAGLVPVHRPGDDQAPSFATVSLR
jgi:hypothetical protein